MGSGGTLGGIPEELWKDFWRILLKDAEQLCKNGQPDLALEALNGAKESGLTSPWTEASRARAYEKLRQWPKALEIWGELTTSKNKDVKKIAIRELNNHQSKVNSLTSDLITTIQQSGNEAKFLPKITPTCLQELEDPILAEVASLQESKSLKLSAKILKKSIAAGLSTPTIKEKLAILLCTLEREHEAIALWQSLLSSQNITVKKNAERVLKQISKKQIEEVVDGILLDEKEIDAQISLVNVDNRFSEYYFDVTADSGIDNKTKKDNIDSRMKKGSIFDKTFQSENTDQNLGGRLYTSNNDGEDC